MADDEETQKRMEAVQRKMEERKRKAAEAKAKQASQVSKAPKIKESKQSRTPPSSSPKGTANKKRISQSSNNSLDDDKDKNKKTPITTNTVTTTKKSEDTSVYTKVINMASEEKLKPSESIELDEDGNNNNIGFLSDVCFLTNSNKWKKRYSSYFTMSSRFLFTISC